MKVTPNQNPVIPVQEIADVTDGTSNTMQVGDRTKPEKLPRGFSQRSRNNIYKGKHYCIQRPRRPWGKQINHRAASYLPIA